MKEHDLEKKRHESTFVAEQRLIYLYPAGRVGPDEGGELQPQLAASDNERIADALFDFKRIPDDELEKTADATMRRAVSEMFNAQYQEEQEYWYYSRNPFLSKLPELEGAEADALYIFSESQESVNNALYGEDTIRPEIAQPNQEGLKTPSLANRLQTVPIEEQVKKITFLLENEGIQTADHLENIHTTLTGGGTVLVDVDGIPVVCGKGAQGDGGDTTKAYYVSRNPKESGFVDGSGGGGADLLSNGGEGGAPKEGSIKLARNTSTDANKKTGVETYESSVSQDFAPGLTNVLAKDSLRIERQRPTHQKIQTAMLMAYHPPITPPHAARNRSGKSVGSEFEMHYSKKEQVLIMSLVSDPEVVSKIVQVADGKPSFRTAVFDLMAFRYGPHTEDALLVDDGDERMKAIFSIMHKHFQKDPHARDIANHIWKTELLHMQPKTGFAGDKKLATYLAKLRLEDCMNPADWRDLASARRKGELPMLVLYRHFPELRSGDEHETIEA